MICDLLRLDRRVIVITGAAGAIGSAVAVGVAEAGATVVAIDHDREALDGLVARLRAVDRDQGDSSHVGLTGDVTNLDDMTLLMDQMGESVGAPDGLVALVGGVEAAEFGPFIGFATATYDDIVDRNLRSQVVTHEAVAAAMVRAGHGGSLVAISAATAIASAPYHALYGAAKAGVMSLARSMALEFGPLGIRVNTVAPGAVETRPPKDPDEIARWEKAALPLGRRVKPVEIAAAVLFLLSDLSSSITGQTLVVDGGGLAKPAFLDADNVPVFVTDKALRDRMRSGATHLT